MNACRKYLCLSLCLLPALWGVSSGLSAQSAAPEAPPGLWIIPVKGDIERSLTAFVLREGRKALAGGAEFIVFEIDTFGGRVDSALQIASFISSIKKAQTIAWIRNSGESMGVSWSAGALIALSCTRIYMARGTSLGAAAPVIAGAGGAVEAAGEKTVSAVRSQMAALAERNGHPPGIAAAMVDADVELWEVRISGETGALTLDELERLEGEQAEVERVAVVSPPGKLLSLTAGEALRYGLARGLADDRQSLLDALGSTAAVAESVPGAADQVLSVLTSGPLQALLIIIGLVLIFLEIQTPGFGIFGVGAILAFLAVFGSGALLGRVGSLEIVLFLLGLSLLAVEIFLLPGFGVAGISGLILIALSLILSMQDFVIPRFDWEWGVLGRNAVVVSIALLFAVLGLALIALLGPRIRLFDGLTLKTRITGTAAGPYGPEDHELEGGWRDLAGKRGIAVTTLRPSGKAEIEGRIYPVEGDGAFIEAGKPIEVIQVWGSRIVVRTLWERESGGIVSLPDPRH